MTEILLNLLWLVIATVLVVTWRVRWSQQRRLTRRSRSQEWIALACSLVLLFFAVSLSDDLREEVILFDASSFGRKQASCIASVHSSNQAQKLTSTPGWAVLPCLSATLFDRSFERIPIRSTIAFAVAAREFSPVRAPPTFLL